MDLLASAADRASLLFASPDGQLEALCRLRASIATVGKGQYSQVLNDIVPFLTALIKGGSPQFTPNTVQDIRATIIDILSKLPVTSELKPHAENIHNALVDVLNRDNENNALLCLSMVFDYHKAYHPYLENTVQHFLAFFTSMYNNLPRTVAAIFPARPATPTTPAPSPGATIIILGRSSFRVLAGCERIVRLITQIYPKFAEQSLAQLIPIMIKALRSEVSERNAQRMQQQFNDFTVARVKTLSFLTYVLRGYSERMLPHSDDMSKSIFSLLRSCPPEAVAMRRELLINMRHILATEPFRHSFTDKVDYFLKMYPHLMVGKGRAAVSSLRPLAASALVDLVSHVRGDMSLHQLSMASNIFCRHLHDMSLPFALQTSSVKLLFNLVDAIYRKDKEEPGKSKKVLVTILYALVSKFSSTRKLVAVFRNAVSQNQESYTEFIQDLLPPQSPTWGQSSSCNTYISAESLSEIDASRLGSPVSIRVALRDVKVLLNTMIFGLKTVVWCIRNAAPVSPNDSQPEILLIHDFFGYSLECFELYTIPHENISMKKDKPGPLAGEKSTDLVLDHFASIFTVLDGHLFHNIFADQFDKFLQTIVSFDSTLSMFLIPQHFLANANISKVFADLLLSSLFQPKSFRSIASFESVESKVRINLFRIVLGSLSMFADLEFVLRPYLCRMVQMCLEYIMIAKDPRSYFMILKHLFRGIGGGMFERLYKEFLPIMPEFLTGVLSIVRSGCSATISNLAVEAALTVPARLSSLLPFISNLMETVAIALESTSEGIVKLGLRTLEFWIDNLDLDFLYPIVEKFLRRIMIGLCTLLRSPSSSFALTAMHVLGAFSGRNRRFFITGLQNCLTYSNGCAGPRIFICDSVAVTARNVAKRVNQILCDDIANSSSRLVEAAADIAEFSILSLLSSSQSNPPQMYCPMSNDNISKEREQRSVHIIEEERIFSLLVSSLISGVGLHQVRRSEQFLTDIARHFALLLGDPTLHSSYISVDGISYIDTLLNAICSSESAIFEVGWSQFRIWLNDFSSVIGSDSLSRPHATLQHVFSQAVHFCHYASSNFRFAGVKLVSELAIRLPIQWLHANQLELFRGLIFSLRDSKSDIDAEIYSLALRTLEHVVRTCSLIETDASPLIASLASVLTSSVSVVRDCAQNLLEMISSISRSPVCELLKPYRAGLVNPVLARRLHTLAPSIRIGFISATAYALSLDPPLIEITSDFFDLLLSLAAEIRHDESASAAANASSNSSTSASTGHAGRAKLLMLQRVESIKLLSAAVRCPQLQRQFAFSSPTTPDPFDRLIMSPSPSGADFSPAAASNEPDPNPANLRNKIIAALFESLRSTHEEVAHAADQGMALACEQERPPKVLLQSCLRPVLSNFAEYQKLSLPLLTMLSRLLKILSKCFNITLSQKLFEHLESFSRVISSLARDSSAAIESASGISTTPANSSGVGQPSGSSNAFRWSDILIPAAILDTFHLLPKISGSFLQKVIMSIVHLESLFPMIQIYGGSSHGPSSPFRLPLLRLINHKDYCADSAAFFLQSSSLSNRSISRLFRECLQTGVDNAGMLIQCVRDSMPSLVGIAFSSEDGSDVAYDKSEVRSQVISIVHILSTTGIGGCDVILNHLIALWDDRMSAALSFVNDDDYVTESLIDVNFAQENLMIAEILMKFCQANAAMSCSYLWRLLFALVFRGISDYTFLSEFITNEVVNGDQAELTLLTFISTLGRGPAAYAVKTKALNLIITPIFQRLVLENRDTRQYLEALSVVLPPIITGSTSLPDIYDSALSNLVSHVLPLSKYDPLFQTSMLQYIWAGCARDNSHAQMSSFIALSKFVGSNSTNNFLHQIRLSLYLAVLTQWQISTRTKVHEALNFLLPSLSAASEYHHPTIVPDYILWTRRYFLSEQSSDLQHLQHILIILSRFQEHFRRFRDIFSPIIISCLDKFIASSSQDPGDVRQVAYDSICLVMSWSEDHSLSGNFSHIDKSLSLPPPLGDVSLLPALLQIAHDTHVSKRVKLDLSNDSAMSVSSLDLPSAADALASTLFSLIVSTTEVPSQKSLGMRCQALLLKILSQNSHLVLKLDALSVTGGLGGGLSNEQCISLLNCIKDIALTSSDSCRAGALHIIRFIRICAQSESPFIRPPLSATLSALIPIMVDDEFIAGISQIIQAGLTQSISLCQTAIEILSCLAKCNLTYIQSHIPALCHAIVNLSREYFSHIAADSQRRGSAASCPSSSCIISALRLIVSGTQLNAEHRKCLIQTYMLFAEKCSDFELIKGIMSAMIDWIENISLNEQDGKAAEMIIKCSMRFATSENTALEHNFYRLLWACRNILFSSAVPSGVMLIGLNCTDAGIRSQFIDYIKNRVCLEMEGSENFPFRLLCYIFGHPDFEAVATSMSGFWITPALHLLFSSFSFNDPMLIDRGPDARSLSTSSFQLTPVYYEHQEFLNSVQDLKPQMICETLATLTALDAATSATIWIDIFPQIWGSFNDDERSRLESLIGVFLSRDWNSNQKSANPNVVQVLLESCLACPVDIAPHLPAERLAFIGRTYNAWYLSATLLQRQMQQPEAQAALIQTLTTLNERDILAGVWYKIAQAPITRSALALQQFGLWPRAQNMFFNAITAVHGHSKMASIPSSFLPAAGKGNQVSAMEENLWHDEWMHSARQLGQWDAVAACAHSQGSLDAQIEAACKSGDWSMKPRSEIIMRDHALHQICYAVSSREADVDRVFERTSQALIKFWSVLPDVLSEAHVPLLVHFQGLVEVQESNSMLNEASLSRSQGKPVDLTSYLTKWRQRLPNDWEDLSTWTDLMSWRLRIFELTQQSVPLQSVAQASVKPAVPSIEDRIWTLLTFAKTARKQQLFPQCLSALAKTANDDVPISTSDAFFRLREQIRVCMGSPIQYKDALALINSINIDYFSSVQKAELFRLKGDALQHLGQGDDANASFSTALYVCEDHGKSWLSWANFCDRVFAMKKDREWATCAVSCYMHAIAYGEARARFMITRVIWLLSYDVEERTVASAFEHASEQVPLWAWLLWLPQLLTCLARPEGPSIKLILQRVARIYPQALHYTVRAFLFEKREMNAISKDTQDGFSQDNTSLSLVEAIVLTMRENHPSLVTEIENMLEEINLRFQPLPQEELLGSVHSLHQKCFKQAVMMSGLSGPIPDQLAGVLSRLSRSFFNTSKNIANPVQNDFVRRYRQSFEADFSATSGVTLSVLLSRLCKWKTHLEYQVTQRRRMFLRLETLSPYLMRFQTYEVEVPGQYLCDHEPSTDQNVLIMRFEPSVAVVRLSHTYLHRRLSILGSDGITYHFLVQYSIAHITRSDERMMQLYTIINRMMMRYKETRKRNLALSVPLVVPLTHRLRLMQTQLDVTSLEKVYEEACASANIDPEQPFSVVLEELESVTDWSPQNCRASRLAAYRRITSSIIPTTTLSNYFHCTVANHNLLWAFKKQFTKQIGLASFLSYILSIGDRSLQKILLSRTSGDVMFTEFYPSYNIHNMIESNDSVPFRLTPNISTFIGDCHISGIMASTIVSLSACLLKHQDVLKNYLYLFVRDDLLSWHATKKSVQTDSSQRTLEYDVRLQISSNTLQILRGIQSFMAAPKNDVDDTHEPINAKVLQLIKQAMAEENLSGQLPTWHPWF